MNQTNKELLDRITAAYNKDVDERYRRGELDFIPKPSTPDEVLTSILSTYAHKYFPETLTAKGE